MKKTYKASSGKREDNIMYLNIWVDVESQTFDLDYHFLGKQIKEDKIPREQAFEKLSEVEKDIKQYIQSCFNGFFHRKTYIEEMKSINVFRYDSKSKEIIDNHRKHYEDPSNAMVRFKANKELTLNIVGYEKPRLCC